MQWNGTQTFIEYLQSKQIIGEEIGQDTGKYQINVEKLMGEKQEYGNGTANESSLKDVYMLEKEIDLGNILNGIRVAYSAPYAWWGYGEYILIKPAVTDSNIGSNEEEYTIKYYGKKASENVVLGKLTGEARENKSDLAKLEEYFSLRS